MDIQQFKWTEAGGWQPHELKMQDENPQLVLIFGATRRLKDKEIYHQIRNAFPESVLFGCSTAGEISDIYVTDDSVVVSAIKFKSTRVKIAKLQIQNMKDSYEAGKELTRQIDKSDLKHVIVLSDGLKVNGSQLVQGLKENLPRDVYITGGLSGDGTDFTETLVIGNAPPESGIISIIGIYGDKIRIGYGSVGGWDPFGPERLITKSKGNVLYELDGKSALELYKKYLGEHAKGLPATALLFPLSLRAKEEERGVVRTVLAINEKEQSMTFAGDLPEGSYARLMKANFDRLIDGAMEAAKINQESIDFCTPELALLISCVGRKMVLKQRIEEEVEGVKEILGEGTVLTGFYSYGEISPFSPGAECELHNQTMTITTFVEI